MHEFGADLLCDASAVVVDDLRACLIESGELIDAVDAGVINSDALTELAAIVDKPLRPGGRSLFKSVGVAIQDWAATNLLARTVLSDTTR